ncbi:peptidoglycan-binding protein [Eubacteriales bacterium OttesenSCG-928-K08]|nr:peptidoglycan-binding protein [Eubacteriales bacterium OttesenSCG-928-K08]
MATIFVYDDYTNRIERFERGLDEAMPYNGGTLTVREFRGSSCSNVFWTSRLAMEAWNVTREAFGRPIPLGYAFKRVWEGGHGSQSQHYAGTAFDVGQRLSNTQRNQLRTLAQNLGVWSYVEPAYLTPTWVHFDKRFPDPACEAGYPLVQRGDRNMYVFVLQDGLNALGYTTGGLDGIFGRNTENAVERFQTNMGLYPDGVVGCNTWRIFTGQAVGIGQTSTVVWGC